jgi:ubiquinone/menaquinone biosynthesis C-methylase UbiE
MILKFTDNRDPASLASRMRAKRSLWLRSMVDRLPKPLAILDVGGTPPVWERLRFTDRQDIQITILNTKDQVSECQTSYSNISYAIGDARDLRQYADRQFDLVHSNSVIEHVGGIDDMRRMAEEIRRVGKRYFVQTPNRYFPIEPHFVFPMFQFLPFNVQVYLVQHFDLGWFSRIPARLEAEEAVRSIQLISRKQLKSFFPEAEVIEERFAGITKSLVAQKA